MTIPDILLIVSGVLLLLLLIILILKERGKNRIPKKSQKSISLKEVVDFFKQSPSAQRICNESNFMPVAVKKTLETGKWEIILTLFDAKKNEIASPFMIYEVEELGEDILEAFGDKDLVVFK